MRDWTITTWTNNNMTSSYNDWAMDCKEVKASCTSISSKLNSKMLKSGLLSPGGAKPKRAFQNLLVSSPALGIDDGVVYLQARVKFLDPKVFVLALDTRDNKLLGAVEFATERIRGADVVYLPSNIGKYINPEDRVLPIPEDDSNWEESSQYEGTEYLKLTRLQFKFLSVIRDLTSRKVSLQAPSSGKASLNDATIAPLPFLSVKLVIRVSGTKLGDYRSQRAYYEVYGPQSDSSLPQLIAFKQFLESKNVHVECSVDDLVAHEDCITVSKIIKEGECKIAVQGPLCKEYRVTLDHLHDFIAGI